MRISWKQLHNQASDFLYFFGEAGSTVNLHARGASINHLGEEHEFKTNKDAYMFMVDAIINTYRR